MHNQVDVQQEDVFALHRMISHLRYGTWCKELSIIAVRRCSQTMLGLSVGPLLIPNLKGMPGTK